MAHLTDMEELLATIQDQPIRDYMREAMSCYMASAYRGCIVLSYIALFDNLLSKLSELSKINSSAKIIFSTASKKKEDQEVYESYLIDQLESKGLLPSLDTSFLTTLRTLRNKSAHPSGHQPSAEEARYIFREVITRFLSHPILSTTQLVEQIIGRLGNSNFFPSVAIAEITGVVAEEIAILHEKAMPLLISKLATLIISTDVTVAKNSTFFLVGLAHIDKDTINKDLQSKLLNAKSDDPGYAECVLNLLSANGKLIHALPAVCIGRIRKVMSKKIEVLTAAISESRLSHPTRVITSIAKHVDSVTLLASFKPEMEKLFKKRPYSPLILKLLSDHPELFTLYYRIIIANAGSVDFNIANSFARSLESVDSQLAILCSNKEAFELLVAVLQAADCGAFESMNLRSINFVGNPDLRARAIAYTDANQAAAGSYIETKLGFLGGPEAFALTYLTDNPVM